LERFSYAYDPPQLSSSADRIAIEACVRRQREDHGIASRANAILLLVDGESCARIAKLLYLDDDTIRGWYKSYRQDGWDALGWKNVSVALRSRSGPISVLNLVWTTRILAASSFWPDWALNTESPSLCRAWHQRKCNRLSSHPTNA
jgi:hypothetical protein